MVLVERHIQTNNKQIEDICFKAARLYNFCNYNKRLAYFGKIENFGESLVRKFFKMSRVNSVADIFTLKESDIAGLEGWGEKSAETIISNINSKRTMNPSLFLSSMGIPTLSDKTAEDLIKNFGNITGVFQTYLNPSLICPFSICTGDK